MAVQAGHEAGPSSIVDHHGSLRDAREHPVHGRLHIVTGPHSAANSHSWQLKLSAAATLVAARALSQLQALLRKRRLVDSRKSNEVHPGGSSRPLFRAQPLGRLARAWWHERSAVAAKGKSLLHSRGAAPPPEAPVMKYSLIYVTEGLAGGAIS